jgi:hypothetical protein
MFKSLRKKKAKKKVHNSKEINQKSSGIEKSPVDSELGSPFGNCQGTNSPKRKLIMQGLSSKRVSSYRLKKGRKKKNPMFNPMKPSSLKKKRKSKTRQRQLMKQLKDLNMKNSRRSIAQKVEKMKLLQKSKLKSNGTSEERDIKSIFKSRYKK